MEQVLDMRTMRAWSRCSHSYPVLRHDGAGVGHEGDESIEHEAVGQQDVEDEEQDGQPLLGGQVQHVHVG